MGGGGWDATSYATTRATIKESGADTFAYSSSMHSAPRSARKVHELLDPAKLNTFDVKIRECLDTDEHPNATPIAVMFDETGSMQDIPRRLAEKLENLFGLLLRKGYCEDPQILVGAIGDAAWNEVAPLQVSQFESDNRIDDALRAIYLEGGGGGGGEESYDLAMYFLANYVKLDSLDKRGKKGYLFLIGDETVRPKLTRKEIKKYIDEDVAEDIPFEQLLENAKETWEIFFIYPAEAHYFHSTDYVDQWRKRLGQNVIVVDDINNICEVIGSTVGLMEGAVDDLDDLANDLDKIGAGAAKGTVSSALAHLTTVGGGAVTSSEAPDSLAGAGASRL